MQAAFCIESECDGIVDMHISAGTGCIDRDDRSIARSLEDNLQITLDRRQWRRAGELFRGQITVQTLTHGPDDPLGCPSQEGKQIYELQGNELVQISD